MNIIESLTAERDTALAERDDALSKWRIARLAAAPCREHFDRSCEIAALMSELEDARARIAYLEART